MNKMKIMLGAVALALAFAGCSWFQSPKSVDLVKDGVAKCRIVVASDASRPEKFGAKELAKYLKKVTGATVEVEEGLDRGEGLGRRSRSTVEGLLPIRVSVLQPSTSNLQPSTSNLQPSTSELQEDGFILDVRPDGIDVIGQNPRGALSGCYEILKRYAGMRWVTPGDDGEYCVHNGTSVTVPVGRKVCNPYLKIRETRGCDSYEGQLWHARNNMSVAGDYRPALHTKAQLEAQEDLAAKGLAVDGHLMSLMMFGSWNKKDAEKLYAVHPEYFPLVKGRRELIWTAHDTNPCVSNLGLIDLIASNLVAALSVPHGNDTYCNFGNNDTSCWCECEKCRALDPPETKGTRGELSDRYWFFMNELGKRVWAKKPDAKLCATCYQNFWFAPVRVKPDPRFYVSVSFNNQCWRHSICDTNCTVNPTMRKLYEGWKKWNMPLIRNRDEIGAWDGQGSPGCEFQPAESTLVKNFREDYPVIGCAGSHFCVQGPFPEFTQWAKNCAPFYGKRYHWYAMWQTCYVTALTLWDRDVDWEAALEEANRLYYGVAWEPAMKEFRALHKKCFYETPGCVGWGQGAPMGRCLDQAGSEEKLKALLEKAVAVAREAVSRSAAASAAQVAAAGGDARSTELVDAERTLKHVLREKEIFEMTWLVQRKKYVENFKELNVYRRTDEIKVDGVLDEATWKNADAVSDFRSRRKYTPPETSVRVTYDHDNLYIAVEAMEKDPSLILSPIDNPDALHRLGDRLEIFYNFPDMNDAAYHLCINSKGTCIAARQNSTSDRREFTTKAKIATKVGKDRWTLEMAIPCSEIGQNCFDGATWKLNVAREHLLKGMTHTEGSSCCKGAFHGPANFMNIKFTPERVKGMAQNHDKAAWKNGGFNQTAKRDKRWPYPKFRCEDFIFPAHWGVIDTVGSYQRYPGSDDNWYVTLEPGKNANIRQYFYSKEATKVKIYFKARGKGKLVLNTFQVLEKDGGHYDYVSKTQKTFRFDVKEEYSNYTAVVEKAAWPIGRIAILFSVAADSKVDLDDVIVTPIGK